MAKNSTRIQRLNCTSLEYSISKKNNNISSIIEEGPQSQTIENIMRYSNTELWQFIKQHPDFTNFTGKDHDLRDWTKDNPEISVNLEKGTWYNHKTGEGGGLYELAKELEGAKK